MNKRIFAFLCALFVSLLPSAGNAQDAWPLRSLRLIVGFPPGGTIDALARAMVVPMGKSLGQSVVVENRPGAAQALAAELVAKAEPDGYSIGLVDSGPLTVSPHFKPMAFDANRSFTPVGSVAKLPLILVASNASGLTGLQDVIRAAQAKPGSLSYASVGAGSMHNLAGETLKSMLKLDILHVPYKGAALAAPDVIAGRVALMFSGLSSGCCPAQRGAARGAQGPGADPAGGRARRQRDAKWQRRRTRRAHRGRQRALGQDHSRAGHPRRIDGRAPDGPKGA